MTWHQGLNRSPRTLHPCPERRTYFSSFHRLMQASNFNRFSEFLSVSRNKQYWDITVRTSMLPSYSLSAQLVITLININWIALQRKSASPVEIHAVYVTMASSSTRQVFQRHSELTKRLISREFMDLLPIIEFCTLCHFKNNEYQNELADILCKAI